MVKLSLKTILVAGIGLVISSLISGYFFSIGAALWELTMEGKLDLGSPFWLVSVPLGIIGILLLIYGIYLEKHKPIPQGENITMPTPSQKRASWLVVFKFRRSPLGKEKRVYIWIAMVMMLLVGVITIYITLRFSSSASLPPEATFDLLIITIIAVGCGIAMITFSTLFMITELYAMWESRKQIIANRKTTYLNILKDFDGAFQDLEKAPLPKIKEKMLAEFQDRLRRLCDYPWNDEVSKRIMRVLDYIPEKLSDDLHVDYYLLFLGMIINFYGKHIISKIKERFLVGLENLYNIGSFDKIMSMLQKLHGYSGEYIMKLVNDAGSTNVWSDSRFDSSVRNIEFWELRRRDQEAYDGIVQYIYQKMCDATRNGDDKTRDRFEKLWESAKGS